MDAATPRTPAALGFAFPAEWTPHAATWMGWPFDDAYWEGLLEPARQEFARLVATIARFEPVRLACADAESEADARARLGPAPEVTVYRLELDDVWLRDSGPLFVRDAKSRVAATDWRFNAWGGKFRYQRDQHATRCIAEQLGMRRFEAPIVMEGGALEISGQGLCLTTRQCLLNPNRNPGLSQAEIEGYLRAFLGVTGFIWLNEGLEGDKTDGHVDTITRWAGDTTILTSVCEDPADPNHAPLRENLELLRSLGRYEVLELPLPRKRLTLGGERLPLTYANFYLGNGFAVVPTFDDPNDERALAIVAAAFPEREVIGLPSLGIITGGGSFHCLTQQQPEGEPLSDLGEIG